MTERKEKNHYTPFQCVVNTIAVVLLLTFIGLIICGCNKIRGIQNDIDSLKNEIQGLQTEKHYNIYTDEENKDSVAEEIIKIQNNEQKTDLLSVLDIMDSRYSNFQSELSLYLTVFSVIAALVMVVIPILNYSFVTKGQIDKLVDGFNNKVKQVDANVNSKIMEQNKSIDIQNKTTLANIQDYNEGVKQLDELVRDYSNDAYVYLCRFNFYIKHKKFELAEKDLEKANILDKEVFEDKNGLKLKYYLYYSKLWIWKATFTDNENDFINAKGYLDSALEINNKNIFVLNKLSLIYQILGLMAANNNDIQKAKKRYKKSIEYSSKSYSIKPQKIQTLDYLATSYESLGDIENKKNSKSIYKKSLGYYEILLEKETRNISAINSIAEVNKKLADIYEGDNIKEAKQLYNKSLKYCEKALKIDPNNELTLQLTDFITKKLKDLNGMKTAF